MTFETPALLWGLLVIPIALLAYAVFERRRTRRASAFASPAMVPNVVPRRPRWRRHVPVGLYLLGGIAMLLALARPQADVTALRDRGAVMLVVDSSKSMEGTDVAPSRVEAARRAGRAFLRQLPQRFAVGLVTFDREARILSLPTTDRAAVTQALDSVETHIGTAIGDGLLRGLEARAQLSDEEQPPATAIVLLSDGNNTTGTDPLQAARSAAEASVEVHTVVLGRDEVVPGQPRPPDGERLRSIAEATNGRFLSASSGDRLETIYGELATTIFEVTERREVTDAFAGAAALLLVVGAGSAMAWFNRFP